MGWGLTLNTMGKIIYFIIKTCSYNLKTVKDIDMESSDAYIDGIYGTLYMVSGSSLTPKV